MTETVQVPLLLQYIFGEAAGMARQVAPERLLRWCQAFEDWLAELQRQGHPAVYKTSRYTWKQFELNRVIGQALKDIAVELDLKI